VLGDRTLLRLHDLDSEQTLEVLCPPDEFEELVEPAPSLDRRSVTPLAIWRSLHEAVSLRAPPKGRYSAF
jgi:hypothetical protein